jgi:membrane protease YdiL (CAAX protease family)
VQRRWAADLLIVIGGFGLVFSAPALAGRAASGPLAIGAALLLIHWRLRAADEGWATLGLVRPASIPRALLAAAGLYAAVLVSVSFLVGPLAHALHWPAQQLERFRALGGHPWRLAQMLLIAWSSAAFGEELVFRGFLQGRLQRLLGTGRGAATLAILLQATTFGACHAYLGVRGIANAMVVGTVFGLGLGACGGNLWPLVLAHGLTDTITLLLLYLGYAGA